MAIGPTVPQIAAMKPQLVYPGATVTAGGRWVYPMFTVTNTTGARIGEVGILFTITYPTGEVYFPEIRVPYATTCHPDEMSVDGKLSANNTELRCTVDLGLEVNEQAWLYPEIAGASNASGNNYYWEGIDFHWSIPNAAGGQLVFVQRG